MALTNVTLLSSTQGIASITGQPVRASGAASSVGSLYTVAIHLSNFRGRVYIEGTLATNPSAEDWFPIVLPGLTSAYLECVEATTAVRGFNFKGNFTWIRARQDREYLGLDKLPPQQLGLYGYVDQIVLNMGSIVADQNLPVTVPNPNSTVASIRGNNVGTGHSLYANAVGDRNVLLNFRSLVAGNGVTLTQSATTIKIDSEGGAGGGATNFVDLVDAPASITARGILVGTNTGVLDFVPAPNAVTQVLTFNGNDIVWSIPQDNTIVVRDEGTPVVATRSINFSGASVNVTQANGVANVNIISSGTLDTEHVTFEYTAGGTGDLSAGDALRAKTTGVTASIIDPANCIVEFTFANRVYPPSAITLLGQVYSTNEFIYNSVRGLPTRKVQSGGTAADPTIMGAFTGPITLQLRMSDVSASATAGQRAKVIVMFKF